MKTHHAHHRFLLCAAILAAFCLGATGCKASAPQPGGQSGTRGVITAIDGNKITIAVMPQGSGPQGGGTNAQPPAGSAQPGGTGDPQKPNGSAPPSMGAPDTSNWQNQAFTIDSKTKILKGPAPGSNSAGDALTATDLKVGDNISVVQRSGQAGVADQITVIQGVGGPGGQGGMPAGAAAPASASPSIA